MSRARHPFNDRGAEVDTKNQRATDPSFNRRDLIGGLLAATALASVPAEAQTQHGGGNFLRKRPSLPAPQAGNALVNPPAIVPGTQGGTNYALNMVQQNFTVAGNTASLYSYADPNNSTPNPNIVGPTIGRLSTSATMAPPETNWGNIAPKPETKGLSAIRTGYFSNSLTGRTPLARAVVT